MPNDIDLSQVKWDAPSQDTPQGIDISQVKWDNEPDKNKQAMENLALGVGGLGAAAGGAYVGGKVLSKATNIFSRVGAGLSQKTLDTVKKEGYSKIRSIAEQPGEHFAKNVIPKARENVIKSILNFKGDTDVLDNLGFKPNEIEEITGLSKGRLLSSGSQISKNWTQFSRNLEKTSQEIGKKIGSVYQIAEKNGVTFSIPKSYGVMRGELKKYGLVDLKGNLTREAETITSPALKNLAKTYSELQARTQGKADLSIPQYRNLINQLEGSLGQDEQFNVPIYKSLKALRNEGAEAINPSAKLRGLDIVKLNKDYADSITLEKLGTKLNQVFNENPDKLESTFNKLKTEANSLSREKYAKIYGKELINEIDKISAARELFPEREGGWTRWMSRQAVKGAMRAGEVAGGIGGKVKQMTSKAGKLAIKGQPALMTLSSVLQALNYSDDPEKALLELSGYPTDGLAPKGSEERKIQLGQIL